MITTIPAWWLGRRKCSSHVMPRLLRMGHPTLHLVGDSITAGMGGEAETWPKILARRHTIDVRDFSLPLPPFPPPGATGRTRPVPSSLSRSEATTSTGKARPSSTNAISTQSSPDSMPTRISWSSWNSPYPPRTTPSVKSSAGSPDATALISFPSASFSMFSKPTAPRSTRSIYHPRDTP